MADIGETWADQPLVHVYGQFSYHAPATIRGNRLGLTALRDAIDAALKSGSATAEVSCSDGEGYGAEVRCTEVVAALGEPEYIWLRDMLFAREAFERTRDLKLYAAHAAMAESQPASIGAING